MGEERPSVGRSRGRIWRRSRILRRCSRCRGLFWRLFRLGSRRRLGSISCSSWGLVSYSHLIHRLLRLIISEPGSCWGRSRLLNCRGSQGRQGLPVGAREDSLIKHSCVADEGLLALQIIELPALVVWRVSNEDALPGVGAKACSLVLLHMDIGQAAKDTQV